MWNLIPNLPKNTFRNESDSEITLAKYEIKYIAKVIRSIENRGIFWKELQEKLLIKHDIFNNFKRRNGRYYEHSSISWRIASLV